MISLRKGFEDYKELNNIVKNVKDINVFVELINGNKAFNITNDLRDNRGVIDVNYKNICATIKQEKDGLILLSDIEVWDDNSQLLFVNLNVMNYQRYRTTIYNDRVQISSVNPYDEQDYHYALGDKIFRNGKLIKVVEIDEYMNEVDQIILELIKLDSSLESKMCYN